MGKERKWMLAENKIITILICCYNGEKFLKRCIDSLKSQTISDSFYKILFRNDGSTDDSLKIAESYDGYLENFKERVTFLFISIGVPARLVESSQIYILSFSATTAAV